MNRLKKAFTILELLVVIIIIGVVSIVAIPNVREFLAERETRSEVITISNIVGALKSDLDGGLSRNPNKGTGDSAVYGTYVMGILTLEQYPDQFRVVKNLRSDEMFKNNKNCDPSSGQWDSGTPTYYQYDTYPGFKNIVITGSAQQNIGQQNFCLAKDPTLIAASTLTIHVCNSYNNPSRTCGINFKNDPIYRLSIQRLGSVTIEKYNYTNATWNFIQK